MEQEKWVDINIPGLDFRFQVSNLGRVKRLAFETVVTRNGSVYTMHHEERLVKIQNQKYQFVQLAINGRQKACYVHRLVAQAFIPNPDNLPEVNHKNEDKYDNRVENLEWCTRKYNRNYGTGKDRIAYSLFLTYDKKGRKTFNKDLIKEELQKKREVKLTERDEYKRLVRAEKEKALQERLKRKAIVQVDDKGKILKTWNSPDEIAAEYGISMTTVYNSLNKKTLYCKKVKPICRFIYKEDL